MWQQVIQKRQNRTKQSRTKPGNAFLRAQHYFPVSYPNSDETRRFLFAAPPGGGALPPASGPQEAWPGPAGKTCCGQSRLASRAPVRTQERHMRSRHLRFRRGQTQPQVMSHEGFSTHVPPQAPHGMTALRRRGDPAPADSSRGQAPGLLAFWLHACRRPRALRGAGVVVSVKCLLGFGVESPSTATGGEAWCAHRASDTWPPANLTYTLRRGCSLRGAWGGPPRRRSPRTPAPRPGRTRWRSA